MMVMMSSENDMKTSAKTHHSYVPEETDVYHEDSRRLSTKVEPFKEKRHEKDDAAHISSSTGLTVLIREMKHQSIDKQFPSMSAGMEKSERRDIYSAVQEQCGHVNENNDAHIMKSLGSTIPFVGKEPQSNDTKFPSMSAEMEKSERRDMDSALQEQCGHINENNDGQMVKSLGRTIPFAEMETQSNDTKFPSMSGGMEKSERREMDSAVQEQCGHVNKNNGGHMVKSLGTTIPFVGMEPQANDTKRTLMGQMVKSLGSTLPFVGMEPHSDDTKFPRISVGLEKTERCEPDTSVQEQCGNITENNDGPMIKSLGNTIPFVGMEPQSNYTKVTTPIENVNHLKSLIKQKKIKRGTHLKIARHWIGLQYNHHVLVWEANDNEMILVHTQSGVRFLIPYVEMSVIDLNDNRTYQHLFKYGLCIVDRPDLKKVSNYEICEKVTKVLGTPVRYSLRNPKHVYCESFVTDIIYDKKFLDEVEEYAEKGKFNQFIIAAVDTFMSANFKIYSFCKQKQVQVHHLA